MTGAAVRDPLLLCDHCGTRVGDGLAYATVLLREVGGPDGFAPQVLCHLCVACYTLEPLVLKDLRTAVLEGD
jgi:hypothetical protein